jgi:hypothetical protein
VERFNRIGDLPRLNSLGQLFTQGDQFLLKLLQVGRSAPLAYILEAGHNVPGNEVLHRFHAAALNLSR